MHVAFVQSREHSVRQYRERDRRRIADFRDALLIMGNEQRKGAMLTFTLLSSLVVSNGRF